MYDYNEEFLVDCLIKVSYYFILLVVLFDYWLNKNFDLLVLLFVFDVGLLWKFLFKIVVCNF